MLFLHLYTIAFHNDTAQNFAYRSFKLNLDKFFDGAAVLGTLVADPQEKRPPAAHRSQRPKRRGRRRGVWSTKERTEGAQDGEGGERATTGVGFRLGFQGLAAVLQ
ncbi:hypothetical protein BHE74_00043918 [Ensete ventricosum]|nr:hypothetical protein BHE74_00043918 [Ensete ventricosum]RZR98262.1 hypothetical protein BHM03_00027571 [Ensete ventricosum]